MPRSSRRRRLLAGAAALAAALLAAALFAGSALVVTRDAGPPDVIVMLASHEWERLPATAALARRYPQSIVVLTLPRVLGPYNCFRCPERPEWLAAEGVPLRRIVQLPWPVENTFGEAQAVRRYLGFHPVQRLVVVTSPYHTRRALATFSHVLAGTGVRVGVQPAASDAVPGRWWMRRADRGYVAYEWAAILYYRIRYGVPLLGSG
jgi:uncharacterized SAM-binding protein YcdF (DUF218 family)